MSLETLDRTPWSFSTVTAHVERIAVAERARTWRGDIFGEDPPRPVEVSDLPRSVVSTTERRARDGVLVALRDGYLRATGRRSTTPVLFRMSDADARWRLHAMDPGLITTTEWREGEFNFSRVALTSPAWEYIDIEVPAFMVKAIWPDFAPDTAHPEQDSSDVSYTTPYIELMHQAIAEFGLGEENQSKKEVLLDWFRTQEVEGEPISANLADAMATLVRLPASQRGGARRPLGPQLSRAS